MSGKAIHHYPALPDTDYVLNQRLPKENLSNRRKGEKKKRRGKKKAEKKSPWCYNTNQLLPRDSNSERQYCKCASMINIFIKIRAKARTQTLNF